MLRYAEIRSLVVLAILLESLDTADAYAYADEVGEALGPRAGGAEEAVRQVRDPPPPPAPMRME